MLSRGRSAVAVLALALILEVAWAVLRDGYVAYDGMFALIWGEQLASLDAPAFEGGFVPTPHPLMNVAAAILSPLGDGAAETGLLVLTLGAAVLIGVAAFRLGRAIWSTAVGVLFAALLLSRPGLAAQSLQASVDVPFLALVLLAAALEAERPRRGALVLVVLALAGLLRPEAWLFAVAYGIYVAVPASGRDRAALLALAAAGPIAWVLFDLLLTGDPLFSLHRTEEVASRIQPDRGLDAALRLGPQFVLDLLGPVIFWGGVAGALASFWIRPERMVLPAALVSLSLVPFVIYGLGNLTLYPRFVLPTAAILALTCSIAAVGWLSLDAEPRTRTTMMALGIAVCVALLISVPSTVNDLGDKRETARQARGLGDDLLRQTEVAGGAAALGACPVVQVPRRVVTPLLMRALDKPVDDFHERPLGKLRRGLELTIPEPREFVLNPANRVGLNLWQRRSGSGLPLVARSGRWQLNAAC